MSKRFESFVLFGTEIGLVWSSPGFRDVRVVKSNTDESHRVNWRHFWLGQKVHFGRSFPEMTFEIPANRFGTKLLVRGKLEELEEEVAIIDPTGTRLLCMLLGIFCTIFFYVDPVFFIDHQPSQSMTSTIAAAAWLLSTLKICLGGKVWEWEMLALWLTSLVGFSNYLGMIGHHVRVPYFGNDAACLICPFFCSIVVLGSLSMFSELICGKAKGGQ